MKSSCWRIFNNPIRWKMGMKLIIFVYRPSEKTLPNTGSKEIGALAVAGTSLLVATLVLSRKSKRLAVTFFALGSGGLLTTTVLADSQLAQFFDTIQVVLGGDIPHPKTIPGYQFTGFFTGRDNPSLHLSCNRKIQRIRRIRMPCPSSLSLQKYS